MLFTEYKILFDKIRYSNDTLCLFLLRCVCRVLFRGQPTQKTKKDVFVGVGIYIPGPTSKKRGGMKQCLTFDLLGLLEQPQKMWKKFRFIDANIKKEKGCVFVGNGKWKHEWIFKKSMAIVEFGESLLAPQD